MDWCFPLNTRQLCPSRLPQLLQRLERCVLCPCYEEVNSSNLISQTYYAALVFLTQKLSMKKGLQESQMLTATHDNTAAWAGIGSALSRVWYQKAVPASPIGVLSAFFYLGNILVLHITTPALFSLQTFNSSRSTTVTTQGFPVLNLTAYNMSDGLGRFSAWYVTLISAGATYFISPSTGMTFIHMQVALCTFSHTLCEPTQARDCMVEAYTMCRMSIWAMSLSRPSVSTFRAGI